MAIRFFFKDTFSEYIYYVLEDPYDTKQYILKDTLVLVLIKITSSLPINSIVNKRVKLNC